MRPEQALSIGLDLLALLCLIGLRTRVPKALFWIAIVAGLALFAIRFSSDAGWIGHLIYTLR